MLGLYRNEVLNKNSNSNLRNSNANEYCSIDECVGYSINIRDIHRNKLIPKVGSTLLIGSVLCLKGSRWIQSIQWSLTM